MAITSFTFSAIGFGTYRLRWASNLQAPTFYLYRDGRLVLTTRLTETIVSVAAGESPLYEVFDDAADRPEAAYPSYVTLAWYSASGDVERFYIDRFIGGQWVRQASVPENEVKYHVWKSGVLADVTTHQFRITPVGSNGNEGDPIEREIFMVRVPDVPRVSYTYDAGTGTVTIA